MWMEQHLVKVSLPLWECGLKLRCRLAWSPPNKSLPLWECGLKFRQFMKLLKFVRSLPLWECGLKSFRAFLKNCSLLSLPLWECGLKSNGVLRSTSRQQSLPLWECGLKYEIFCGTRIHHGVTPFVGVWIEIGTRTLTAWRWKRHSLCGSVDWNVNDVRFATTYGLSLPLWECGLKLLHSRLLSHSSRHSLCGSVDWNRGWIRQDYKKCMSLPLWECGLKSTRALLEQEIALVTPFVGVWIEIAFARR